MPDAEFSDAFAAVLTRHRRGKRLSKEALAQASGLHQTYIGLIERGLRNPTLDTAHALANALGVPLSELIVQAERIHKVKTAIPRKSVKKEP